MNHKIVFASPVGPLALMASDTALLGLWYQRNLTEAEKQRLDSATAGENSVLNAASRWLTQYFQGQPVKAASLPLDPPGTAYQRRVLLLLAQVPFGRVTSYQALAQAAGKMAGRGASARAVGNVMHHNPISIIIPCHRVIAANGGIGGYSVGLPTKRQLLKLEGLASDTAVKAALVFDAFDY